LALCGCSLGGKRGAELIDWMADRQTRVWPIRGAPISYYTVSHGPVILDAAIAGDALGVTGTDPQARPHLATQDAHPPQAGRPRRADA